MAAQEITGCSALETSPLEQIPEEPNNNTNNNTNLTRRSLSIFSRKGATTPKPAIDRMPSVISKPKPAPRVQRKPSTMFRAKKQPAQIPEGTILRAVPPATNGDPAPSARSVSTLELEMATSPNDEILSAIRSPTLSVSPTTPRPPYSATSSLDRLSKKRSQILRPSSKRSRAPWDAIPENMIGVWRHGQTQWVDETMSPVSRQDTTKTTSPTASRPRVWPAKKGRPQIRVIIPSHRLNAPLPSLPLFASNPQPYNPLGATMSTGARTRSTSLSTATTLVPYQPQPLRRTSLMACGLENVEPPEKQPRRTSSSGEEDSSSNDEHDDTSNYSRSGRSSVTSVGSEPANPAPLFASKKLGGRTGSQAFSIVTPAAAGIYDDEASAFTGSPLPRSPSIAELPGSSPSDRCTLSRASSHTLPSRRRSTRRMSSRRGTKLLSVPPRRSSESARRDSLSLADAENALESTLTSFGDSKVPMVSMSPVVEADSIAIVELPAEPVLPATPPPVPARSKRRLTVAYRRSKGPAVTPVLETPKTVPAIAERSKTLRDRRRESRNRSHHDQSNMRSQSLPDLKIVTLPELLALQEHGLLQEQLEEQKRIDAHREITAQQAERVIKHIMTSLSTLDDLFSTALLNKGFHRVYRRYELELLWAVLKNASLPAWEFMQAAQSSPILEHNDEVVVGAVAFTPSSFITTLSRSQAVLGGLKQLIHTKCQSFLRPSTFSALLDPTSMASARIDAALWRIWTFCCIFGSNKAREDDIIGQRDWINGGFLAHQQTCTSTIVSSDSFGLSDVLLNASEHFGCGNGPKGLDAEDLYDMTELWNCMKWLVEALEGRTEQARQYGVFDYTDVRGGDIDGEEAMLEEYSAYLLTLGLEPIFIIASALHTDVEATLDKTNTSSRPFALASSNGWTNWTAPPPGASRCHFLKESLTRMYEERIQAEVSESDRQAAEASLEEAKVVRRQRGQSFAQELVDSRRAQQSEQHLRPLGLADERPMSDWELVLTKFADREIAVSQKAVLSKPSARSLRMAIPEEPEKEAYVSSVERPSPTPTPQPATAVPQLTYNKEFGPPPTSAPSSRSPSPPSQHSAPRGSSSSHHSGSSMPPISPATSLSDIHPAFREEVAISRAMSRVTVSSAASSGGAPPAAAVVKSRPSVTFDVQPLQAQLASEVEADRATNTADRAVERIVEMGFTSAQASYALMKTDFGDGLNIDGAVELLLQEQGLH